MNRISDFVSLATVIPPAPADEDKKNAASSKPALYHSGVQFQPALHNLTFPALAGAEPPAPGNFVSLASLGVVSSALTTAPGGHIPEHGPTGNTMPFYDQGDSNACGPTSLSMIFRYFGIDISREEIDKAIRRAETGLGTGPGDLIEFARDHGLEAEGYNNGTWEEVKSMIDQGHPVIPS